MSSSSSSSVVVVSNYSYARHHATITYREVRNSGLPVRPLDFPPPKVLPGVRVNALVVHPQTGSRQVCSGVIHREDLSLLHQQYQYRYHAHHRNNKNTTSNNTTKTSSSTKTDVVPTSSTSTTSSPSVSHNNHQTTPKQHQKQQQQQRQTDSNIGAPVATVSPSSPDQQQQQQQQQPPPPPITQSSLPFSPSSSSSSATKNGRTEGRDSSSNDDTTPITTSEKVDKNENNNEMNDNEKEEEVLAYWPQRRLQDAIYGSVWACLVLRRHYGVAADDAARAAHVEPGSINAPIVWEITGQHVAIKMVEWSRVHHMRGRLLEDPVKEVAALQMLDKHPNVLHSTEVLQDADFLYSVMPYCRDGDLFGIVVKYAEDSGGEIGMPEPVARYWFRQILNGLHHLQHKGVCHRDLSLENVLVDHDKCYIMDMGMCLRVPYNDPNDENKIVDVTQGKIRRLIKPQGVCGKHNYMSPEIAANTEAFDGFAIDLWAAGVILYIMLTGFPPYDHANRTDQRFELIITGRLMEQLKNWDILLSDEAGDLMQKMLQYHPKNRLTLAEVMDHPWVTNDNVEVPPPEEPGILSF